MAFTQETKQALFNEMVQAIIKQGKPCRTTEGCCMYADGAGNHCGIGHLLKNRGVSLVGLDDVDASVSTSINGAISVFEGNAESCTSTDEQLLNGLKVIGADCKDDLVYLEQLQKMHDKDGNINIFKELATRFAIDHNFPELA